MNKYLLFAIQAALTVVTIALPPHIIWFDLPFGVLMFYLARQEFA